ncbi:class I SAM-dependent methyltransferase [Larkinella soli]|uniref:class I SAM-dependent methyltransferase n=1 Tax=Larkinella soli TaxID=1770527 RepID=UPI000FFB3A07|nr:class I SAM-dependent methyltransferase [Larkinella soli]
MNQESYQAHEEHIVQRAASYLQTDADLSLFREGDVNYFIHRQFWQLTDALAKPGTRWLTVGDLYGADAAYLQRRGCDVLASDLSDAILSKTKAGNLIRDYSVENVEKLSFPDRTFDYVYCKEAYHHFPRPALGFYEMIRVCRRAVVIQEPLDPIAQMPLLLFIRNLLDRFDTGLLRRLWKNQYSFETVGNYVFKISLREFEKMACGMGLPMIAYKGFNPGNVGAAQTIEQQTRKIRFRTLLSDLSLLPSEALSVVIFKEKPTAETVQELVRQGYRMLDFPPNPYLH